MKKALLRTGMVSVATLALTFSVVPVAMADGEVTADPTTVYLTDADKAAPGDIEFTSGCASGYDISWEFHEATQNAPGNTGWNPVRNDMTVDNTANATTLKIAKTKLNESSTGRLYRAVCTKTSDTSVKAYSKPAGMFWLALYGLNLEGQGRNIVPLPEFNAASVQGYQVKATDTSRQVGISTYLGNVAVAPGKVHEIAPTAFGQYWGSECTVSWKKGTEEVATGFIANIPVAGNIGADIKPTVTCPGGKTLTVPTEEWARLVAGTDFSDRDPLKGYGLFADPKWACIPDEAFGADGKSTEKITYTWKLPNEDKGNPGELTAKIQLREQKADPKEDEWSDADNLYVGTYQGGAANPKWTWAAGSKAVPAYLTFDNDAHTITVHDATREELDNLWIRILFIHNSDATGKLAGEPMWLSSYAATRQTHQDRTPQHPFDLETGDAVRYCTPWKLDGDHDGGGLNIPRDVNNHRATGTGTPNDPYSLYVEPGKPIVNFTADDWMAKYDGPNRFLHYFTRWDIFNEETKTWEPYRLQDLNATDSYLNVPRSKFKNGTKFRAYLSNRVDGGYVYFQVTEVAKRPKRKLANSGITEQTLPLLAGGTSMILLGLGIMLGRRKLKK